MDSLIPPFLDQVVRYLPKEHVKEIEKFVVSDCARKVISKLAAELTEKKKVLIFLKSMPMSLFVKEGCCGSLSSLEKKIEYSNVLSWLVEHHGEKLINIPSSDLGIIVSEMIKAVPLENCIKQLNKLPDMLIDKDDKFRKRINYIKEAFELGDPHKMLGNSKLFIELIDIILSKEDEVFRKQAIQYFCGIAKSDSVEKITNFVYEILEHINSDHIEEVAIDLCDMLMYLNCKRNLYVQEGQISARSMSKVNVYRQIGGFINEVSKESKFCKQISDRIEKRNILDSHKEFVKFVIATQRTPVSGTLIYKTPIDRSKYKYPAWNIYIKLTWLLVTAYNKWDLVKEAAANSTKDFDKNLWLDLESIFYNDGDIDIEHLKSQIVENDLVRRVTFAICHCITKSVDYLTKKDLGLDESWLREAEIKLSDLIEQASESIDLDSLVRTTKSLFNKK